MAIEITCLTQPDLAPIKDQIVRVYGTAFAAPPYRRTDGHARQFAHSLEYHAVRPGFRMVVARDGADGPVVGFTYGYTGAPGQWWHDTVAAAMSRQAAARWLGDYFELVERAVDPPAQGHHTGSRLHDTLLDGLPHRTAALSTMDTETTALHLYERRGWIALVPSMYFPNVAEPYRILGLDLRPAATTPAAPWWRLRRGSR
jgi:ribosomal protein S18 acetylase RimI-like enzyme